MDLSFEEFLASEDPVMGSGTSISIKSGMPVTTEDIDEKKKLLLKGTTRFFELDEKREGLLDVATMTRLVDDILQDYKMDAIVSKEEIKRRVVHKMNISSVVKMNMPEFFALFEESCNYVRVLSQARRKFHTFDTDGNGKIEGEELEALTTWVLESYQPDTYVSTEFISTPKIRNAMKEQIMKRVDVNKDGAIDMDEFTLLFEEVTFKIDVTYRAKKKFTELDENDSGRLELLKLLIVTEHVMEKLGSYEDKELAKRLVSGRLGLLVEETMSFHDFNVILESVVNHIVVMRSAREKFIELDVDGNGYLEGMELDLLLNWMLSSFCPNGEPLPLEEKVLLKEEMIRQTDDNRDGRISIAEFSVTFEEMTMMLTLPSNENDDSSIMNHYDNDASLSADFDGDLVLQSVDYSQSNDNSFNQDAVTPSIENSPIP